MHESSGGTSRVHVFGRKVATTLWPNTRENRENKLPQGSTQYTSHCSHVGSRQGHPTWAVEDEGVPIRKRNIIDDTNTKLSDGN